jgi:hypothetical protein
LVVGIIVILVGVFVVSTGRGGELAYEQADHAPLELGPVSATDVALLRPPTALWGYNMQVTDEALDRIARALRDRDIEIAYLQRQLADLGHAEMERDRRDDTAAILPPADQPSAEPEARDEPSPPAVPAVPAVPELPRRFVAKHERPRPGQAPDNNDGDSVAAAEEQAW